jgi:hypothetical protein
MSLYQSHMITNKFVINMLLFLLFNRHGIQRQIYHRAQAITTWKGGGGMLHAFLTSVVDDGEWSSYSPTA